MMRKVPAERYADCNELEQVVSHFSANRVNAVGTSKTLHQAVAGAGVASAGAAIPLADSNLPADAEPSTQAGSRTEEIEGVETLSTGDEDNPAMSPFAIETSAVPDAPNASVSSIIMTRSKPAVSNSVVAPKIRVRRRKKPSVWLAPAIIGGMLLLLLGVATLPRFRDENRG